MSSRVEGHVTSLITSGKLKLSIADYADALLLSTKLVWNAKSENSNVKMGDIIIPKYIKYLVPLKSFCELKDDNDIDDMDRFISTQNLTTKYLHKQVDHNYANVNHIKLSLRPKRKNVEKVIASLSEREKLYEIAFDRAEGDLYAK